MVARDWADPDSVAANINPATATSFNEGRDDDDMQGSITFPLRESGGRAQVARPPDDHLFLVTAPSRTAAIQQISIHGGTVAVLAMMPLLALVGFTNGNAVAGTSRPVASAHVATTGVASTR